ncbi:hypothetical protein CGH28_23395 [Vibrio parahaemolyticus]|nr:hypothetical protein FORC22_4775 [Vibrio parahaemolyticus]TOI47917.1 hypothetical protein CGI59_23500 [Vibrio parahaemolyticus]TOO76830.1 hypothetical protein CGH28_23395 [Vibrio parahaemolyticus]
MPRVVTKPTTKANTLPIRFAGNERAGLTTLGNDIKSESMNSSSSSLTVSAKSMKPNSYESRLIFIRQHSYEEIIDAINQVKLNIIR